MPVQIQLDTTMRCSVRPLVARTEGSYRELRIFGFRASLFDQQIQTQRAMLLLESPHGLTNRNV